MIYVNITNSYVTQSRTGIQRVVKCLTERFILSCDCSFLVYQGGDFYKLTIENVNSYLKGCMSELSNAFVATDIKVGDIFFDIDGSWGDPYDIGVLYRKLKSFGMIIVKLHYDAVPLLFPKYCHENTVFRYLENFVAALHYADHWICISRQVERDLISLSQKYGCGSVRTHVFELGAEINIKRNKKTPVRIRSDYRKLSGKKYILSVGTVEPRKNYELILDSFDVACFTSGELSDVELVIVGKSGWNNERLVRRISTHPLINKRLHWFKDASDEELDFLYENASVCLCLSHYEGFGLPVIEALQKKVPVICSRGGAMEEASKGQAYCVAPVREDVVAALSKFFSDEIQYSNQVYKTTSWNESFRQIEDILDKVKGKLISTSSLTQAVYISIRPQSLKRSIESLNIYADFIKEFIVLTSDDCVIEMRHALDKLKGEIKVISEGSIGLHTLPEDHLERNSLLRKVLYNCGFVHDNFLALDDDCIAVSKIIEEDFIECGQYKSYYFYDAKDYWLGALPKPTSFDVGLWRTICYLERCGYESRLYNSHQPQVINKAIALDIYDRVAPLKLDEWSSYFNIAKHLYPHIFLDVFYVTAGWPANFDSWLPKSAPGNLLFYNDYEGDLVGAKVQDSANKWRAKLQSAIDSKLSINPIYPSVFIDGGIAYFSNNLIQVPKNEVLHIPILTSEKLVFMQYKFGDIIVVYQGADIPSFIHVPLARLEADENVKLEVVFRVNSGVEISTTLMIGFLD